MVRVSRKVRILQLMHCALQLSPQAISSGMLRRPPTNLNRQSEEATVLLIREVLKMGLDVTEVSAHHLLIGRALKFCGLYRSTLTLLDLVSHTKPTSRRCFPASALPWAHIERFADGRLTHAQVTPKADSKFKIVGAASVAAKVTRDALVEGWLFEEDEEKPTSKGEESTAQSSATHDTPAERPQLWGDTLGSGYPSGQQQRRLGGPCLTAAPDPKTQEWLKTSLEPTFGFPSIVRFSWTTVKVLLEKHAHAVKWSGTRRAVVHHRLTRVPGRMRGRPRWSGPSRARQAAIRTAARSRVTSP
jgi:ribonuclease H2 subunit A